MDYSQATANFAFYYSLEWRGRQYLFSFMSDQQRAWFEQWMKQSTIEEITANTFVSEAERDKLREKFIRDVKNRQYIFGGPMYKEAMQTPEGQTRFLQMMLVEHQPDITPKDVEAMVSDKRREVSAILSLVMVESVLEIEKTPAHKREVAIKDLYAKLQAPELQGGLGLSMAEIVRLTDRQKVAMLKKQESESKPEMDTAAIDAALRAHAAKSGN